LTSLPGVANLQIDDKKFTVTVSGDPAEFKTADAVAALDDVGFPAEDTQELGS